MPRKKNKKVAFSVTLICPEGATPQDVRDFIFAAVCTHQPEETGDPMFQLDTTTVRVKRVSVV